MRIRRADAARAKSRGTVGDVEFVCLAAGRGTRFGRLGAYLQKCMYPIGLTPFVAFAVRNLTRSAGFDAARDRLTFVVGHHAEQVEAYFGDAYPVASGREEADPGGVAPSADRARPSRKSRTNSAAADTGSGSMLEVRYVRQEEPLGTGHALHVAARALAPSEPVIAWLADLYVPAELFARVRAHPGENVLTVCPDPHGDNPNVAVTKDGPRIARAWQGTGPSYDIGLWKLSPAVLGAMLGREVDEVRALPSLQREIDAGRANVGWVDADAWIHLGGTAPSPEANVRDVARRIFALEPATQAPWRTS